MKRRDFVKLLKGALLKEYIIKTVLGCGGYRWTR